jgi:mono/diheme cytochrome c family protein
MLVRSVLLLAIAIFQGMPVSQAQVNKYVTPPWNAPETAMKVKNPFKPTRERLRVAARLYKENCASCHGANGAGNGPLAKALVDKPVKFTNVKAMKSVSDGELYWKITNGRLPMPSFAQFSDAQRWELVEYLRTLAK